MSSEKIVLILVGFVGSGKSTFAQALEHHFPHQWRRCNQDDLGSRSQVEALARDSLREGLSVCIDRTNIDESQREHWIKIAHEFPETLIWVIFFDTPYEVCSSRLQQRTSHPTIHSPELGLSILSRFARDFRAPSAHEGFHRMISLKPPDTKPDYLASDISSILDRVRSSEPVLHIPEPVRNSWARKLKARHTSQPNGNQSHSISTTDGNNNNNGIWEGFGRRTTPTHSTIANTSVSSPSDDIHEDPVAQEERVNVQYPPLRDSLGID
ncbi:P-loop containing nucleoside triphosphate hydrolase protein [Lentinula raphanica]|nr:P-loop containing nucleoside triphosphate hydrolase protein [Lentinula raphanica]